MLERLEAADRAAELHPVLGVLDRHVEHPARAAEHLGRREDGTAVERARRPPRHHRGARPAWRRSRPSPSSRVRSMAGSAGGRPTASRSTRNSPGPSGVAATTSSDRRPTARTTVGSARPSSAHAPPDSRAVTASGRALHATAADDAHRRPAARRRRRDRAASSASMASTVEANGTGRRVPADLLEQHRELDGAEPEPAALLGEGDAEPPLLHHRRPDAVAATAPRLDDLAHGLGRRHAVEQLAGAVAQRDLIFGEVEIHTGRRLARGALGPGCGVPPDRLRRLTTTHRHPPSTGAVRVSGASEPPAVLHYDGQGGRAPRRPRHARTSSASTSPSSGPRPA